MSFISNDPVYYPGSPNPNVPNGTDEVPDCPQNQNKITIGKVSFEALGDRLLIEEDPFRSGYECSECGGSGKVACDNCGGTTVTGTQKKCSLCDDGKITCPLCEGKGGLLVAPETAQRRPTTGRIVSVGPECKHLKVGASVMFSNFAGYVVDLSRAGESVVLRILHESEILCRVEGQLEMRALKGKSEVALHNA